MGPPDRRDRDRGYRVGTGKRRNPHPHRGNPSGSPGGCDHPPRPQKTVTNLARKGRPKETATNLTVEIYTPAAPAHGNARAYVRNRNVWVLVVDKDKLAARGQAEVRNIRSPAIVEKHRIATEVDSRYWGLLSRYGQALARAEELVYSLRDRLGVES